MRLFLIERNFAQKLQISPEEAAGINEITDQEKVRWLYSFLSVDQKETFCLYEASSAEAIRQAAGRAGIPADAVFEVTQEILPNGVVQTMRLDRFG